ncbi:MAG: DNA primase [bacterium]
MSDIEEIKQKLNIVDVVREYIPNLKKSGRNWSSLSPFRNEKTPSFMVNEELGIWKDFGGDKSGDVVTFVMEMENVEFRRALEICANKAGIELKGGYQKDTKKEEFKKKLLAMNSISAETFFFIATKHALGVKAREYIKKRNFTDETVKKYKIGYAPYNLRLQNILKAKLNIDPNDKELLISSGLFVERYDGIRDKFQDRLMFPIRNTNGDLVGFSGRIIDKTDARPKYINSPETLVYKKSEMVFNLYEAKSSIKKNDFVILTEGQIDCIISSQAGVENIVAPLGTALTIDQLKILKRYTENICLCFNNDSAGFKAIERAFALCTSIELNCKVIELPEKEKDIKIKDIDELITVNKSAWETASKKHNNFIEYLMRRLLRDYDLSNPEHKKKFVNYILGYIGFIKDTIEKQAYIQKLSVISEISEEILDEKLSTIIANRSNARLHPYGQSTFAERTLAKNEMDRQNTKSTYVNTELDTELSEEKQKRITVNKKFNYFLALLINFPEFLEKNIIPKDFTELEFVDKSIELLNEYAKEKKNKIDDTEFFEYCIKKDPKLEEYLSEVLLYEVSTEKEGERDLNILFKEYARDYKKRKLNSIKSRLEKESAITRSDEITDKDLEDTENEILKWIK